MDTGRWRTADNTAGAMPHYWGHRAMLSSSYAKQGLRTLGGQHAVGGGAARRAAPAQLSRQRGAHRAALVQTTLPIAQSEEIAGARVCILVHPGNTTSVQSFCRGMRVCMLVPQACLHVTTHR